MEDAQTQIIQALVQASTLLIGALAAYFAQKIYDKQKLIGRGVQQSNNQNESLCVMIAANTKLCEEITAQLKAAEGRDAKRSS